MVCVNSRSLQRKARGVALAALFLATSFIPVASILVDDDIITAVSTSEIPPNSVLCPGGHWSVAVTTFGVARGSFGKARPRESGGVDAFFAYQGTEVSVGQEQPLDLLVFPTSGTRQYHWVSVAEYQRNKVNYRAVRKGHCSPFAFFHPGDGAQWQLGRIDLESSLATYTINGMEVRMGPEAWEEGKILVMKFKEDSAVKYKHALTIALAIFLNVMALGLMVPFFPRRFWIRARVMPAGNSNSSSGEKAAVQAIASACQKKHESKCERRACSLDKESAFDDHLDVKLLNQVIGSGAFGVVEKGTLNGQPVAVKFVNPVSTCGQDAVSTITHELEMLQRIPDHDNVVHCYGRFVDEDNRVGLVEELMQKNMSDWIHEEQFRGETTMRELLDVFIDITKGLEHLHQNGVVHYDLKPKNVLLDKQQRAKVADFGCSRIKAKSYITAGLHGTLGYLAPECILSMYCTLRERVRAEKIDVFSLGVVMWEALVGSVPYSPGDNLSFSFGDSLLTESGMGMRSGLDATSGHLSMGTDYLNNCLVAKFPIAGECPEELKALVSSCVNVSNRSRPSCRSIRKNLEGMRGAPWADFAVGHVIG